VQRNTGNEITDANAWKMLTIITILLGNTTTSPLLHNQTFWAANNPIFDDADNITQCVALWEHVGWKWHNTGCKSNENQLNVGIGVICEKRT
jgi:hypothetical protein